MSRHAKRRIHHQVGEGALEGDSGGADGDDLRIAVDDSPQAPVRTVAFASADVPDQGC